MPRVRWAVRCKARRSTDGAPCAAWAIRGGEVCAAHGGSLTKTRQAAYMRRVQRAERAEFARVWARWQRMAEQFHTDRIETTSRLLGIPPERVDQWRIIECQLRYGVPPSIDDAPKITDVPASRRFTVYMRTAR